MLLLYCLSSVNQAFNVIDDEALKTNIIFEMFDYLFVDHEVYSWGNNSMGQCGLGHSVTPVSTPTKVPQLDGVGIEQLCAGTSHSIVWTTPPIDRCVCMFTYVYDPIGS